MNTYKVLNKQIFSEGEFSIVPIRFEDRMDIMKWRNEQIYHLRQTDPLTEKDQNAYFENVVSNLFDMEKPNQILFSLMKKEKCIGYGGLVHINWGNRNAELSFIMDTELEQEHSIEYWTIFIKLIENVAFYELRLHKIFTYAFDLRPQLYSIFETMNFEQDARLRDHILFNEQFIDVVIHSKLNRRNGNY